MSLGRTHGEQDQFHQNIQRRCLFNLPGFGSVNVIVAPKDRQLIMVGFGKNCAPKDMQ